MSHVTLVLAENPALKEGRFRIEVKKKAKKAVKEESRKKEKQPKEKPSEQYVQRNDPGFFRRIFRRKSV